jgi:hypothetical protein
LPLSVQHFALTGIFNSKVVANRERTCSLSSGVVKIQRLRRNSGQRSSDTSAQRPPPVRSASQLASIHLSSTWASSLADSPSKRAAAAALGSHGGDGAAGLRAATSRELSRQLNSNSSRLSPAEVQLPPQAWDDETQALVLKLALKCADLGHLTSSKEVHQQWVARLEEVSVGWGVEGRNVGTIVGMLATRRDCCPIS